MTDRDEALREEAEANAKVSVARRRPTIWADGHDITEAVVSVTDALSNSLDAGSGFLDASQETAMETLMRLLVFDCREYKIVDRRVWLYCGRKYGHSGMHGQWKERND